MSNKIKTHYVEFSIAKKLKEKGFNTPIRKVYNTLGQMWDAHYTTMANDDVDSGACCTVPEHWQVVDWLLEKHGIWVYSYNNGSSWIASIQKTNGSIRKIIPANSSPQEAYSAAFDYILEHFI